MANSPRMAYTALDKCQYTVYNISIILQPRASKPTNTSIKIIGVRFVSERQELQTCK